MEHAVVDPEPAILHGTENLGVAMAKANLQMIIEFSGVDGLRCNNVIARHHDGERNVGRRQCVGVKAVKRTCFIEDMKQRPAQRQRRTFVPYQRQLVEAPERLAFHAHHVP